MTSPQAPLHSGFNAKSTAREVLSAQSLAGKLAVVTGGYAGCGLETTRALALAGATVIAAGRSLEKGRPAIAGIPRVELEELDLASPASIDAFAARLIQSGRPLHLLINNAGIMAVPLARDSRGYESQFATNHLGHFQLTARLWPALQQAQGARVVALTSRAHVLSAVDVADPNFEQRPYEKWKAYGQSKTANALFALALDARGEAHGVRAFSVHPGAVRTELARSVPDEELAALRPADWRDSYKSPEQGAATSVWCAASPRLEHLGGVYCEDVDIAEALPADSKAQRGVRPWATDKAAADALWTKSEELTAVRFQI